jgi:Cys-tRNA(Pro)/Cys-tRNA(Cys) deacylase
MTPAIIVATNAKIAFRLKQYEHDTTASACGLEAVEKLSLDPARVFKSLIFETPQRALRSPHCR